MNKITATFSNGQVISRSSTKSYSYAYRSENIYQVFTGFASSAKAAQIAARGAFPGAPKPYTIEVVETAIQD